MAYRTNFRIFRDILTKMRDDGELRSSEIGRKCNLSYDTASYYISILIAKGYSMKSTNTVPRGSGRPKSKPFTTYSITGDGLGAIVKFEKLIALQEELT